MEQSKKDEYEDSESNNSEDNDEQDGEEESDSDTEEEIEIISDDRFVKENGQFDFTLVVENHKIHVSKAVLCIASPVFRTMFESDFKEKDQKEVELHGKKYDDVIEFLCCLYPDRQSSVTENTVYEVLPLASEYQVRLLEDRCDDALIEIVKKKHSADINELFRHIQLAELYGLEGLRRRSILLASEFKLDMIEKANTSMPISDKSLMQMKDVALKRHELDKGDDHFLSQLYLRQGNTTFRESLKQSVEHAYSKVEKIRNGRLQRRFFPEDEAFILNKKDTTRKFGYGQYNTPYYTNNYVSEAEQAMLLPEVLKQLLQLDDNKEAIQNLFEKVKP